MVQGYYTLEEASRILDMSQEKLSQMAQRREVRAFADRGTWRFRTQDIDEMARRMGRGSNPELQLGEASKVARSPSPTPRSPRPAESPTPKKGGDEGIFNFQVSSGESSAKSQDIIVDSPSSRKLSGKSSSRISPSPKPGSDSDVKLVPDGSDVDFRIAPDSDVRLEQPPRPGGKPGSSKRVRPEDPKSSGRRKTGMPGADAGVRLIPMEGPGAPAQPPKTPADSDIRFEEYRGPSPSGHQRGDHSATEEIDLDAELRQAEEMAKRARAKQKPKTGMPQTPATSSDFEISPAESQVSEDRTAEFPIPPSDDQVELGELPPRDLTTAGGDSGINLGSPADSGIDLEKVGDSHAEKVEFELGLEDVPAAPAAEQPAAKEGAEEEDSSSEFELSLDVEGTPPPANTKDDSSSEFELSLDVEGTPPPAKAEDSSSEFELTLDGTEGLAPVEEGSSSGEIEAEKDIFETDFEVPAMSEGAASDAADLEEHDTALESSDFDLSLVGESASQVVDLGEQSADESSDTISRSVVLDEDAVDDVDELLEDDLGGMRPPLEEEEEEELVAAPVAAAPASWGVVPAIFLIPCVLLMFLISLMSFEMLHSLIGYEPASQPSGALVKWVARAFGEKISD
jgi:hypothetical protein